MASEFKATRWWKTIAGGLNVTAFILVLLCMALVANVLYVLSQDRSKEAGNDIRVDQTLLRFWLSEVTETTARFTPTVAQTTLTTAPGNYREIDVNHALTSVAVWLKRLINDSRAASADVTNVLTGTNSMAEYSQIERDWASIVPLVNEFATTPSGDRAIALQGQISSKIKDLIALIPAESDSTPNAHDFTAEDVQAIVVLAFLGVACVLWFTANGIARRTRLLTQAVGRIAEGDLTYTASVPGADELAYIADAFNHMTTQIRTTLEKEGRFFTLSTHLLCVVGYDGRFKRISSAWQHVLKQSEASLLTAPLIEFIHKSDRDPFMLAFTQMTRSGAEITSFEARCVATDGHLRWLSWNMKPVPGDELVYCVVMEVTERHQAELDRDKLMNSIQDGTVRLSGATSGVLSSTNQQARGAQEQAAAIAQTVAAVEEVEQTTRQSAGRAAAVSESSQLALENGKAGRKAVEETIAAMERVRQQVESIAENILTLAEQAQNIGEIVSSVDHIADQTNLLALNAAIEAARAGEQGKGFTVVANEIRLLADQSKRATVQVRQMLSGIQKLTQRSVLSMEEGTRSVNEAATVVMRADDTIRELVDTVTLAATSATQILTSANQQSVGMKQIHQAMRNIQDITSETLSATQKAQAAVVELNGLADSLKAMLATNGHAVVVAS